jgi:hypothetical protein
LRSALAAEGLGAAELVPEPQAAAVGYVDAERVPPGSVVAIYDLGGGTFDAAVVRKSGDGGFEPLGRPEGLERLGGVDFDEVIFSHVRSVVGAAWDGLDPDDVAVRSAAAALRRECTAAKEALSGDTEVRIPVILPGIQAQVPLVRAAFEEMIRPAVAETVDVLLRVIDSAGVARDELAGVLLVGGSSRIPLIGQLVSAAIGRAAAVDADPKGVIAAGASIVARGRVAEPPKAMPDAVGEAFVPDPTHPRPPTEIARPIALRPNPRRPGRRLVGLGIAAAVLAALVAGGGALAEVYRTAAASSDAEATTPSRTVDPSRGPAIEPALPEPSRSPRVATTRSAPPASAPPPPSPTPPPAPTATSSPTLPTSAPSEGPAAVAPPSEDDPAEGPAPQPPGPDAEPGG